MRTPAFLSCVLLGLVVCAGCADQPQAPQAVDSAPAETLEPDGLLALTLPDLVAALTDGRTTSEALVQSYLDRIERIDRSGPTLQSVLAVDPSAIEQARASDQRRAEGSTLGALDGIPILLKDNIESAGSVPTTAGALALADNVTDRDAPLVAGLRAQGAVILGKTNLSQWANFRSQDSISGWSALGGQVRNPHLLDRSPCGSSSGSGAAVAASLAAGAVGTETNGSIICPSTVNGVVGFKPTVGLVSQRHIVPISSSQDTAGPMTKTVEGAALMLTAMATGESKSDYRAALDADALEGARLGVARFAEGSHPDIIAAFDRALEDLAAAGAELVEIEEHETPAEFWNHARSVLRYEFKATLNEYLAETADTVTARNLAAVIAFNESQADVELALFGHDIFEASVELEGLDSAEYLEARDFVQKATRADGIDHLLAEHEVVALVSPSGPLAPPVDPINGDVWPAWAGAGWMAAIAGYPHLTVPMGTVEGLPIGLSFLGAQDRDAEILALGYAYEQHTQRRVEPSYLPDAEALPVVAEAMRARR
ncbi:MAG: amidase [Thermoanaerobaculia bacterium]|nr:amidase [Thermoanaerobaculia bacterium]